MGAQKTYIDIENVYMYTITEFWFLYLCISFGFGIDKYQ